MKFLYDFWNSLGNFWNSLSLTFREQLVATVIGGVLVALLIAFWKPIKSIVTSLIPISRNKADNGIVPAPSPQRVTRYIERSDEEHKSYETIIEQILLRGAMVTLWGSGGVGKTIMATTVANKIKRKFKGGIAWIDVELRAYFTFQNFLDELITQLGYSEEITPYRMANKVSVTRIILSKKKCLVVVDGFEIITAPERKKIIDFLEKAPASVLITSLSSSPKGENVHLRAMTEDEAEKFVRSLLRLSSHKNRFTKEVIREITKITYCNPLTMKWVVRQIERGENIVDLSKDIASEEEGPAQRIFQRTTSLLNRESTDVLRSICLFSSSVSKITLSYICSQDKSKLDRSIRNLMDLDLVYLSGDRLEVYGLIKKLANLDSTFIQTRKLLVYKYYSDLASSIDYFSDSSALDNEYENIFEVFFWLFESNKLAESLELFNHAGEFIADRSGHERRIEIGRLVTEAAAEISDLHTYSWHLVYTRAWAYLREGTVDRASVFVKKSLSIAEEQGYKDVIALCLRSKALICSKLGHTGMAIKYLRESLRLWEELKNHRWISMSKTYLAELTLETDLADSLRLLGEAEAEFNVKNNLEGLAWVKGLLGKAYKLQNQLAVARSFYQESINYRKKMRAPAGLAHSLFELAVLENETNNQIKAIRLAKDARNIYNQLGTQKWVTQSDVFLKSITFSKIVNGYIFRIRNILNIRSKSIT